MDKTPKVFISHSYKDRKYAGLMINLLKSMGHCDWEKCVFCSSIAGHDIPLRNRIYDYIKKEFDTHELYVLFLLSENFYNSPASLNEMGATWITNQPYCMILLPGFSFKQIEGVVDSTLISIDLNQSESGSALNKLRDDIVSFLKIKPSNQKEWERTRNHFSEIIQKRKEEKQVFSQKTNPLDILIVNYLYSKGETGASLSEIKNIDTTCDPLRIIRRLHLLVENNIVVMRGNARKRTWHIANNNQMNFFLREIERLETKINSIPDYSKPSEWTP
jgi:hypothetical protein